MEPNPNIVPRHLARVCRLAGEHEREHRRRTEQNVEEEEEEKEK